ncbi:MAG TPA: molybdopterin cofactor-binding domain-containing protein, partial [Dehalococcoidia bacterium]|nr:molybdopterin cofactor-binding domain-containing protein [Dehalococcoidia bacterium]
EGVAAVAAADQDTLQEALALIRADYEELPAVFDPEEAMTPGAPKVHDADSNVAFTLHQDFGDVEEGFRRADYLREDVFYSQPAIHGALEPQCSLASYETSGHLTVWSTTQSPFRLRRDLSSMLGLAEGDVRAIKPHLGGGFCGRLFTLGLDMCSSLLSIRTGRPVRITFGREETFFATRGRVPMKIWLKTGVKWDGTLVGCQARLTADNGAYNSLSMTTLILAGSMMNLPYRIPNVRFDGYLVYTNNQPTGAQRGAGNPQIRFATESQLDMIAEALRLDPVEVRLKNSLRPGDTAANGFKIATCGLPESVSAVAKVFGASGAVSPSPSTERGPGGEVGWGLACAGHFGGGAKSRPHDSSSATIKADDGGSFVLFTGASDIGQGSDTTLAQIAAEVLGARIQDMRVVASDTALTPADLGTFGSRVTMIAGNAVVATAEEARRQLLEVAAEVLEARVEDMEAREGRIHVKGSPDSGISLAQAAQAATNRGRPILAHGSYNAPTQARDPVTAAGDVSPAYAFGAQGAEVQVDTETGHVEVRLMVAAQDVGFAINPMAAEGQLEGSVSAGLGQALSEDIVRREGQVLNPSFLDYKMPTVLDTPAVQTVLVETRDPAGPFGAKGMGESGQVPTIPAVANALRRAGTAWMRELPLSPEKVLRALAQNTSQAGPQ